MNKKIKKLAEDVKKIAYELEVFGVKTAAKKMFEYELSGFRFYTDEKVPAGIRLPVGKARWTRNYYPVSGQLAKGLEEAGAGQDSE